MSETVAWWFSLEVLGLLAFPLTFLVFRGLGDRGYSFAKIVGLLVLGYVLWLAGVLGILPFARGSVILLLLLFAIGTLALFGRNREAIVAYLRERWRYVLIVEALFAISFLVAAWARSFAPDIGATEKPMEVALLSGLARDSSLPAQDPWLSGHDINYYYFGYLMMAGQMKLLGIGVAFGFNLALSTVVALGSVAGFGIVYNLLATRAPGDRGAAWGPPAAVLGGLAAVALLFIYSNYEGVLELLAIHGVDSRGFYDFVNINELTGPRVSASWYPTEHWYWWRASRLFCEGCPLVITEFPFFSFLLGDLHPHVLAIPFFLLTVAVGWNMFVQEDELLRWRMAPDLITMAIAVGAIGFIHTINLPVVVALMVAVYALRQYRRRRRLGRELVTSTGLFAGVLTLGSLLVYLPFYLTYNTPTTGLLAANGPDTRPFHLFLQWGLFLLLVTGLAAYAIGRRPEGWRFTLRQIALAAAPGLSAVAAWLALRPALASGPEATAGAGGWLTLVWLAATLTLLLLAIIRNAAVDPDGEADDPAMLFALTAAALAVLVILGSELFFVKDVFNSRLNTVFKGWYAAWLLLAPAAAFSAYVLLREWRPRLAQARWLYGLTAAAVAVLLIAGLVYPVTATMNRTGGLENRTTLDGLAFLNVSRPGERDAIRWLDENVSGRPVIMEAIGDSFTEFGRVSAYTGLPAILGWPGHENQWRGSFEPQGTRVADVETAYTTMDAAAARAVLAKYGVEFVYVGPLERGKYEAASLDKFGQFMDVAYKNDEVTIYQRRAGAARLANSR